MKKIVITFGLISGFISAVVMSVAIPLCLNDSTPDFDRAEIIGYSSMVLSGLAVFFGIRTYRENVGRGAISFGRAFKVGLLIVLVSCAIYVVAWQIVYYNFIPDFMDKYTVHTIEKMRSEGATDAAILAKQKQMADFAELYKNPLVNIGFTFIEPIPVGLLVTLVSAAILRKKPGTQTPVAATAIA